MAKGDIHMAWDKERGEWVSKVEGEKRVLTSAKRKEEARREVIRIAALREVELFIYRKDHTIQDRRTYPRSRDPRKSAG